MRHKFKTEFCAMINDYLDLRYRARHRPVAGLDWEETHKAQSAADDRFFGRWQCWSERKQMPQGPPAERLPVLGHLAKISSNKRQRTR